MGSPITFSGFNKIDFSLILNAIMEQERAPISMLDTRRRLLETQNTAFAKFAGKLAALESAAKEIGAADSLALVSATSSDASAVSVTSKSGTVEGTYDIVVSELARAQVTASSSTYAGPDTVVADGGTLSLVVGAQAPIDITVSGTMTLAQLGDAINTRADAPVSASIVEASPGSYKLVLTSRSTGTADAFTITSSLTGGAGLTFIDTNGDGVSGDSAADNAQSAGNAALTVNSIPVTSATNTIENVVAGATLTLLKKDAAKNVTVSVTRDDQEAVDAVEKFITAYNDVLTFIKTESPAVSTNSAGIGRDPVVRGLRDAVRSTMFAEYLDGGTFTRLAAVGLGTNVSGMLTLDKDVFTAALSQSLADVQKLFGGPSGSGGAFGALTSVIADYTEAGGLIGDTRQRLDSQVHDIKKRLDDLESRLAVRRNALQREFTAADLAMTRLNSQSGSLSALGGQFRLF